MSKNLNALIITVYACLMACGDKEATETKFNWELEEPFIIHKASDTKLRLKSFNDRQQRKLSVYDEIHFSMKTGLSPKLSVKSKCGKYVKHTDHLMPQKVKFIEYLPKEALLEMQNPDTQIKCHIAFRAKGNEDSTHKFKIQSSLFVQPKPTRMIQIQRDNTSVNWFNTANLMQTKVISPENGSFELTCESFKGQTSIASLSTYLYQMVLNNGGNEANQQEECVIFQYNETGNLINLSSKINFRKLLPKIQINLESTKDFLGPGWEAGYYPIQLFHFLVENNSNKTRYLSLSKFTFEIDLLKPRNIGRDNKSPYVPLQFEGIAEHPEIMKAHERKELILSLPYVQNCFAGAITLYYRLSSQTPLTLYEYADEERTILINEHQIIINEDYYLGNAPMSLDGRITPIQKYNRGEPTSHHYCPEPRLL